MTGIDAELFRHRSCRRHLLEDPQDATDHPAIVYARLARLAAWKMGLNRCPGVIRQPQQMRHSGLLISETQRSRDSTKRMCCMSSQPSACAHKPTVNADLLGCAPNVRYWR